MRKWSAMALVALPLLSVSALAADPQPDPELANFRAAYTTGDGLAYVVIADETGEKVYRYGDASRQTAKKDLRGYMLFTCRSPHVFLAADAKSKAALLKAKVVKAGDPGFADLDAKYVSTCKNPFVKTAVPPQKKG